MAVDACSENSTPNTSPRLSFSIDLRNTNSELSSQTIPSSLISPMDSFSDFNFFFENSIEMEPSSADELFSHGLIMPKQMEPKFATLSRQSSLSNQKHTVSFHKCADFEVCKVEDIVVGREPKSESKSFWKIGRSNSLHCDNSNKKSSIWSLPLLSRSNSTGSVPFTKTKSTKDNNNKPEKLSRFSTSSSSSCSSQRPPLKKKNGVKYNANGVPISHILNAPPPIISTNLFGFGSLFSNGKDKKGRK